MISNLSRCTPFSSVLVGRALARPWRFTSTFWEHFIYNQPVGKDCLRPRKGHSATLGSEDAMRLALFLQI
jgi:hypothetical protein